MAISFAALTSGEDLTASDTSITTASITFGSGNKKMILIVQTGLSGGNAANTPTDTQSGTWASIGNTSQTSDNQILYAFERTGGTTGVSGTITCTIAGSGWYVPHWAVIEATGSTGAVSVVGSLAGTAYHSASTAPTVDCGAAASGNAAIAALSMYINAFATDPTSPWTELVDDVDGYSGGLAVQGKVSAPNTATFTRTPGSGTVNAIGLGIEFSEAAGAGAETRRLVNGGLINNSLAGGGLVQRSMEKLGNLWVPDRKIIVPVGVQLKAV